MSETTDKLLGSGEVAAPGMSTSTGPDDPGAGQSEGYLNHCAHLGSTLRRQLQRGQRNDGSDLIGVDQTALWKGLGMALWTMWNNCAQVVDKDVEKY